MKKYIFAIVLLSVFSACKQNNAQPEVIEAPEEVVEVIEVEELNYPENLSKVFDAHGGVDKWKSMKSLAFTMEKPEGNEVTTTNLNSREALIEGETANIGFDGNQAWFLNKSDGEYKGYEPLYYYNLMFYFYAMPFILADDGINYAEAEPLVFDGITYPGIEITYDAGVGETPEDRYVLYYNSETYKMEWLGYTVSFVPGIDKKELHFRKYSDWQEVNGLLLPKTIVGYGFKDDKPTEAKKSTDFINVQLSNEAIETIVFAKPEKGEFVN
jgi:hypothetical protein